MCIVSLIMYFLMSKLLQKYGQSHGEVFCHKTDLVSTIKLSNPSPCLQPWFAHNWGDNCINNQAFSCFTKQPRVNFKQEQLPCVFFYIAIKKYLRRSPGFMYRRRSTFFAFSRTLVHPGGRCRQRADQNRVRSMVRVMEKYSVTKLTLWAP